MRKAGPTLLVILVPCITSAVYYKENLTFGMRDSILLTLALSQSDRDSLYIGSMDGFVFSSHDGGISWEESRLIVQGTPFFGALRPARPRWGAAVSASDSLAGLQGNHFGEYRLRDQFTFDYGSTHLEYLDASYHPTAYDAAELPGFPDPGEIAVRDQAGDARGGDASRLGVALQCAAPRLKSMLRFLQAQSVGMNLQQLLVEMGVEPTVVNQVAVHPADHRVAFAATSMGTFRTEDGGASWGTVFAGTNRNERDAQAVRFDPWDGRRVYLGTMEGLFISDNRGDRFSRVSGTMLEDAWVKCLLPVPLQDGALRLLAGTTNGAFVSDDRGETWDWIFFETLPETNFVTALAADGARPDRIMVATQDGIFLTADRGRSWERSGGLLFTSTLVTQVAFDPRDGSRAIACTERNVWESRDGGRTWSLIYLDDGDWYVRSVLFDPRDPEVLWVLTSAEILRLRPRALPSRSDREETFRSLLAREPAESRMLQAVFDHLGVSPRAMEHVRRNAGWNNLLPQVRVVGGYLDVSSSATLSIEAWKNMYGIDNVFARGGGAATGYGAVVLMWDLRQLLFDPPTVNYGRVFETTMTAAANLKYEVIRYHEERIRLMRMLVVEPPDELMKLVDASLRFRELTEHLDALTGGLYARQVKEIGDGGVPWLAVMD